MQRFGVNWLSDHAEAVIRPLLAELSLVFHTNTGEEEEDRPSGGWELTSGHWSHGSPELPSAMRSWLTVAGLSAGL